MQSGKIGVTTENIFPVIKKFLYSDHEIFLRELVSNAVDATQKMKTLVAFNDFNGELGNMDVRVTINKEEGTLTVSDHGIGMTAEDIDKYINQIAFSGAGEFLEKYKDTANSIIGHFGLGFYSAFMVSSKVEIRTLSYKEGAQAVKWTCDGSPEYTIENIEKDTRGTDVVLYLDEDSKEFLEQSRIDTLLKKYCRFLPVPVISGKEQEWKDGKMVNTDKDNVINKTEPKWTKKPSELTDDDYLEFYHELYPGQDDPLFWIHLNVDYPFTLTGILYFPKIKNNLDIRKDRIQLYCNQVYVTDSVEGVVPEFMMLLQGVIDSPDIPLNVSRSYLQSDSAVKKISSYITKKVSSRLEELFSKDRKEFENKWNDIRIFIEYGILTDAKFADAALKFMLIQDTEGQFYTLDEYKKLIESSQTDKDGNLVYLYTTDPIAQFSYVKAANDKGYNVLVMDGQLDGHLIGFLENKFEKTIFARVDSASIDSIISKTDSSETSLNTLQRTVLTSMFTSALPKDENVKFLITFESLGHNEKPVLLTQNEYMRRMKDMAAMQPGMSFYGELPDSYNMVINTNNPHIEKIIIDIDNQLKESIQPILDKIDGIEQKIASLREENKKENEADNSQEIKNLENTIKESREEKEKIIKSYTEQSPIVGQLVDLALLGGGLLKGEDLSRFINRSLSLLS